MLGCVAASALAVVVAALQGRLLAGVALAVGLLVGSVNGGLARRSVVSGLPFTTTSFARLLALTTAGLLAGVLLGFEEVWLAVLGLGLAQLLLAGVAAFEVARR
jgi:hypothetical protein